MEVILLRKTHLHQERCTSLFAKMRTSLFANCSTFLFAKKRTLLFAVYIGQDPETLYNDLCSEYKTRIDPCVLYTFRCAVYYAENEKHDPALLKWWNWKNKEK